jgi:hypothetical protein
VRSQLGIWHSVIAIVYAIYNIPGKSPAARIRPPILNLPISMPALTGFETTEIVVQALQQIAGILRQIRKANLDLVLRVFMDSLRE